MPAKAIVHEQTRDFVYPLERNKLAVRIKVRRKGIKSCTLIFWNRHKGGNSEEMPFEMKCYARDSMFDYYETVVDTGVVSTYCGYYFEINDSISMFWLNYNGICNLIPKDGFFSYAYTNERDIFRIPDWSKGAIFYQIFPERFCNGDKSNDPEDTDEWGSEPTGENFMGGDLKGITGKIEYLKELGIDAIYFNPIFEAPANHKYDTMDYFKIDPYFGSLDDFKELVNKCHANGIRVILDGVFNHCGYYFPQFQDVVKNGENSKYKDWFHIESFPVSAEELNYECIGYYKWMPKLRMGNPEVRDYILKVARYWIEEAGIDGWRLDVPYEVDYTFWHEFRMLLKSIKPECFILAETWKENTDMLRGDQMDSVMNYPFRSAFVDFFAERCINSSEFDSRINKFLGAYVKPVHDSLYNLIGSHDTERFLTICEGDVRKLKLAVAFQFCFPGIPVIYYGDEVGLSGENDPCCRKAMVWDEDLQNREILNWYKKLINLRKANPALMYGEFMCNVCSLKLNLYGCIRKYREDIIYVVVNNSLLEADVEIPVCEQPAGDLGFIDVMNNKKYPVCKIKSDRSSKFYNSDLLNYRGKVKVHLPEYGICILKKTSYV